MYIVKIYLTLEYELLAEQKRCKGNHYTNVVSLSSVAACAAHCHGKTSVFIHGLPGTIKSELCYCWTDSLNGECAQGEIVAIDYNLYRFKKGKFLDFLYYSQLIF